MLVLKRKRKSKPRFKHNSMPKFRPMQKFALKSGPERKPEQ